MHCSQNDLFFPLFTQGDLEAGSQFIGAMVLVMNAEASLENKIKTINAMFSMLGVDKTLSIASRRRRRRSISGSSSIEVSAVVENSDKNLIKESMNLQFKMVSN